MFTEQDFQLYRLKLTVLNPYVLCAIAAAFLLAMRFLLTFFYWGGEDKQGGHVLHLVSNILVHSTQPFFALVGFGVGGFGADLRGWGEPASVLTAVALGIGLLVPLRLLSDLNACRPPFAEDIVGRIGIVVQTVPMPGQGIGKVRMEIDGRAWDYRALTQGPELPVAAEIVVVKALAWNAVEVVLRAESDPEPSERLTEKGADPLHMPGISLQSGEDTAGWARGLTPHRTDSEPEPELVETTAAE